MCSPQRFFDKHCKCLIIYCVVTKHLQNNWSILAYLPRFSLGAVKIWSIKFRFLNILRGKQKQVLPKIANACQVLVHFSDGGFDAQMSVFTSSIIWKMANVLRIRLDLVWLSHCCFPLRKQAWFSHGKKSLTPTSSIGRGNVQLTCIENENRLFIFFQTLMWP